ncbi:MAG: ribonuclease HII [Holosporaceae bacterium]|jgi:ribonuclease HII|nr:ribonuclease HII [Holosporaceae bacterium]
MYLEWYNLNKIDVEDSIGIDEVGRGPLAGPVLSAAVWISRQLVNTIEENSSLFQIKDSKKLSHQQRCTILEWIGRQSTDLICYSVGSASVEEIDEMNILQATLLSMKRAYDSIQIKRNTVLIDGNVSPNFPPYIKARTIIKGDDKVLSISLASIIAKEHRDEIMRNLAKGFPEYKWETNVGYGTKFHFAAIRNFGLTEHHRKSFVHL